MNTSANTPVDTFPKFYKGIGMGSEHTRRGAFTLRAERFILPRQFLLLAGAQFVVVLVAYLAAGISGAQGAAAAGLVSLVACTILSWFRKRATMRLATEIDEVLHGKSRMLFTDCREGDLAVLRNEIAKMTARLQRTAEQLEQEKAALGDALADLSHQIRTPLTAIQLMVPVIERTHDSEARSHKLYELENMVDRVSWLVTTLLKIAKFESGALAVSANEVHVATAVQAAIKPFEIAFDVRDITCEVSADTSLSFQGDSAWTIEALGNLVKNCMEHTPAGGEVAVRAIEDAIAVHIRVSDTGPGIPREDLPHLFDRFYRGKHQVSAAEQDHSSVFAAQGFGLGLSLAQSCISAQGGTLRTFNTAQGGACFEVTFPKMTV